MASSKWKERNWTATTLSPFSLCRWHGSHAALDPEGLRSERDKRKALRLIPRPNGRNFVQFNGFSRHANTRVREAAREDLYRLVKYLCRPTIAGRRVTECDDGRFRVELKTPWQDGTKAVLLTASELTGRLLAATPHKDLALPGRPFLKSFWAFGPAQQMREVRGWRSSLALGRTGLPAIGPIRLDGCWLQVHCRGVGVAG